MWYENILFLVWNAYYFTHVIKPFIYDSFCSTLLNSFRTYILCAASSAAAVDDFFSGVFTTRTCVYASEHSFVGAVHSYRDSYDNSHYL